MSFGSRAWAFPMKYYYFRNTHEVAVRIAYAIRRLRWLSLAYPKYWFPVVEYQRPRVHAHHWCRVEQLSRHDLTGAWLTDYEYYSFCWSGPMLPLLSHLFLILRSIQMVMWAFAVHHNGMVFY